jgi:class 3 adenylate cyclase/tetratricopeptide (TPR) repeat protein
MQCPKCDAENADSARFCGECGHALIAEIDCPRCRAGNLAANRYCNRCGSALRQAKTDGWPPAQLPYTPRHLAEKILTVRSALEGERKQVTVLFVDVKGSMDLAARVDPEEWHSILDRFFQILADGVHRFEGTINQFTGDGIMALFGAPVAHEDHAQRACYSALYLRDQLRGYANELRLEKGLEFAVRLGLNSGEVVVGRIGDDLRMDYTAQGQIVGLAERMQSLAEPGTIYLAEATARLVEGFFELEDLGPCRVKGVEAPLQIYRLRTDVPMRTRLDVARARGLSRFVGRQTELDTLDTALEEAAAGRGTVVGIVGKPGTGKSRLCHEFAGACRARGIKVIEVHGMPHGARIPLWPVVRLFRRFFEVDAGDDPAFARQKIAGRVALLDRGLLDSLSLLFDFLGVPESGAEASNIDPEAMQRRLFEALRRLLIIEYRRQPTVTILEDLHWIDEGSDILLHRLVQAVPDTRALLVVTFRPEYEASWSGRSSYRQVPLAPLTELEVDELLADLVGQDDSLDEVKRLIRQRAGGNPLYVEEMVRSLIDDGRLVGLRGAYRLQAPLDDIGVPPTIQALIESRIDRLEDRVKQVLMLAAVIGKQFSVDVLEKVSSQDAGKIRDALHVLRDAEYIFPITLYPNEKYVFAHPLTQEVAYATQLGDQRRQVHAAVAGAIIEGMSGDPDRKAAVIAHHYEQGGKPLDAARWHRRAARWSGRNDLPAAYEHWSRVRSLLAQLASSPEIDALALSARWRLLNLGWRIGIDEDTAHELFVEGTELAERLEDLPSQVAIQLFFGATRMLAGRISEALQIFAVARRLADSSGDENLMLEPLGPPIHAYIVSGRLRDGLAAAQEALAGLKGRPEAGRELFGLTPSLYLRCCRGDILLLRGKVEAGVRELEEVVRLARASRDYEILCWALGSLARSAALTGHRGRAAIQIRECLELAEEAGALSSRVRAALNLSIVHLASEAWDQAAEVVEAILPVARERRIGMDHEPFLLACLAQAYSKGGRARQAVPVAVEAVEAARRYGTRLWEIPARLALAGARIRSGAEPTCKEVTGELEAAQKLIEETGGQAFRGWCDSLAEEIGHAAVEA